jgi:hypothetical protein
VKANDKKMQDIKNNLYGLYIAGFLLLLGVVFRNLIPWSWLRLTFEFGFIYLIFESIKYQWRFYKLKRASLVKGG